MPIAFGTSKHWLLRAEEARTLAGKMTDEAAQRAMLDIAANYEKIAQRADARKEVSPDA